MALHLTPDVEQALFWILVLIGADTAAGILAALVKGTFRFSYIANFMRTAVLPYVGGLLILALLAAVKPDQFGAAFLAAASVVALKFLGDIIAKLTKLGVPVQQAAASAPATKQG